MLEHPEKSRKDGRTVHPNAFPAVTYQKHTRRIPEQSLEVLEACSFFAYFFGVIGKNRLAILSGRK